MPTPLNKVVDAAGDAVRKILAYHGSPHSFDKFDASKIGTGEGAQSFGHGLYFAGNENVAEGYRKKLSGGDDEFDIALDGVPVFRREWPFLTSGDKNGTNYIHRRLSNYSPLYMPKALENLRQELPSMIERLASEAQVPAFPTKAAFPPVKPVDWAYETEKSELENALRLLTEREVSVLPPIRRGKMYDVEINHPPDSLLDWDAPFGQQPESVKAFSKASGYPGVTGEARDGERLWYNLKQSYNPAKAASTLVDAGVPGIRYLDRGSRAQGSGTYNYVMFPGTEDSISILRKYGLLPAVGVGAAAMSQNPAQTSE